MGNYKFKMSDMLPNSWFHKLKDMTKPKSKPSPPKTNKKHSSESLTHHSSISYFSNNLGATPHYNSPRNSLYTRRSTRKTLYKPKLKPFTPPPRFVSAGFDKIKITGQDSSDSFVYSFYGEEDDFVSPSSCKISSSGDDIVIDMKNKAFTKHKVQEIDVFNAVEKAFLASNGSKKQQKTHLSVKINKEKQEDECRGHQGVSGGRKSFVNSQGFNLKRVNSPRIQISATRRSTSKSESKQVVLESFAVMKRSVDPEKDFRESMVEMIAENKIKASKDLEDLLACYLSLNRKEYHDIIIQVFEQIWLQLTPPKKTTNQVRKPFINVIS